MSESKHTVYRSQRVKLILRRYLGLSDDAMNSWMMAKGYSRDRAGCIEAVRREFPWMIGTRIK